MSTDVNVIAVGGVDDDDDAGADLQSADEDWDMRGEDESNSFVGWTWDVVLRVVFMSVKGKDVVGSICKGLQTESIEWVLGVELATLEMETSVTVPQRINQSIEDTVGRTYFVS